MKPSIMYAIGLLAVSLPSQAHDGPHPRVIDSDTVDVGLDKNLRIIGYDGPEKGRRAKCDAERDLAKLATAHAQEIIADADKVEVVLAVPVRRDRYRRYLGGLTIDGRDYAADMVSAGYLAKWDYDECGKACKPDWCAITQP